MISGIYQILNTINEKFYVGSATDFTLRWAQHKWEFKNSSHDNTHLQRAWNKYREEAFEFIVIEACAKNELLVREQFWIDSLKAVELGYNMRKIAHSNLGMKWTKEHKNKIAATKRGVEQPQNEIDARNAANRKLGKWPHLLGIRCKCDECRIKRNKLAVEKKWEKYVNSKD